MMQEMHFLLDEFRAFALPEAKVPMGAIYHLFEGLPERPDAGGQLHPNRRDIAERLGHLKAKRDRRIFCV